VLAISCRELKMSFKHGSISYLFGVTILNVVVDEHIFVILVSLLSCAFMEIEIKLGMATAMHL
jgi:hypothetical protein